ncbi:MAG: bacillithiol biosynthesis cysteine-adding enzyme BshC [Cyclobacteriaceae bacterium]|nr:bacillithiol biosynthesis cysteine-adding enzyme BshC [Cyclobacteriaceae bacterium]
MLLQKVPLRSTRSFSDFFLKYIEQDAALKPYYSQFPEVKNFKEQIKEKTPFPSSSRNSLVETLNKQYSKITNPSDAVKKNIQSLADKNTFTVVTGHQLNIFTGPLYFIYKIVTVINACKKLKATYPESNFVPVYWMASEDHDYEEIKYFRLYGKKYTWETDQKGAVGHFNTKELKKLLQELPGDVSIFKEAYEKNELLSDAVRHYVNKLFGNEGLIVIDADDRSLKNILKPVIREDLMEHTPFNLVSKTSEKLQAAGFHTQVNPREINFFYNDKGLRSRLEKKDNDFIVVDTDLKFSKAEIDKMIEETPEKFSPNVILRPLYQEMILPNLAYVGGPSELVYWLQLKDVFKHFNVPFPALMPRNFAMIVDHSTGRKLAKTGLEIQDFFEEKNYLYNHWVTKNSSHNLSLGKEMKTLEALLEDIYKRSIGIDPTLGQMTKAESKRIQNGLERVEKKMLRAEKRLQSDKLRQLDSVKDSLFPNGSLQERSDNFLNFYQQDPSFIEKMLKNFDPFDYQFNVLTYHE